MKVLKNNLASLLFSRQGNLAQDDTSSLLSLKDYDEILSLPNKSIEDIANSLVGENNPACGMSLCYGNLGKRYFHSFGKTGNNALDVNEHTICDLASVTKLFLSFAYGYLQDELALKCDNKVSHFCKDKFRNIGDISINDLLHFNCCLTTDKRITEQTYENAIEQIYYVKNTYDGNALYSDIPAIVLGELFEIISGTSFGDFVDKRIITELGLKETFWRKPSICENIMDYSGEMYYFNNEIIRRNNKPLIVNDDKAQVLSNNASKLCGHAGIFSSAYDMSIICTALLNEKIISAKALNSIGIVTNTNNIQRFGAMCYCKSPVYRDSDVYWGLGGNAFSMSGFTGTYLSLDPQNNYYLFIGANKLSNRISKANNTDNIDGTGYVFSKDFVYKKDELRDACFIELMKKDN